MPIIFSNTWKKRRPIPFGRVEDAVRNTFVASSERWIVHEHPETVANPFNNVVLLRNVWLPSDEREGIIDLQKKSLDWNLNFAKNFRSLSPSVLDDEPFTDKDQLGDGDASDGEDEDHNEITRSIDASPIGSDTCEKRSESSACDASHT